MGGLVHRMLHTVFYLPIGALAISALPPFKGFISECWGCSRSGCQQLARVASEPPRSRDSNNVGILWVAVESATLVLLLVSLYRTPAVSNRRGSMAVLSGMLGNMALCALVGSKVLVEGALCGALLMGLAGSR